MCQTCVGLGWPKRSKRERMSTQNRQTSPCCFRPSCDVAIIISPSSDWPTAQPSTGNGCALPAYKDWVTQAVCQDVSPHPVSKWMVLPFHNATSGVQTSDSTLLTLLISWNFPAKKTQTKTKGCLKPPCVDLLRLYTHHMRCKTEATIVSRCCICIFTACMFQRSPG